MQFPKELQREPSGVEVQLPHTSMKCSSRRNCNMAAVIWSGDMCVSPQ